MTCALGNEENSIDELTIKIQEKSESSIFPLLEDLCEWLSKYMNLKINPDNFFEQLDNGFVVLKLAEKLQRYTSDYVKENFLKRGIKSKLKALPKLECQIHANAKKESFFARENAAHFIEWCRLIGLKDSTLFESEGLVLHKQLKHVVLTLLELARVGSRYELNPIPSLIRLEKEIEEEEAADSFKNVTVRKPRRSKVMDLDAKVLQSARKYNVELEKVKDGKYSVNGKMNVFVRELRNHIMVRVGGGWDELDHFLSRHDPDKIGKILVFMPGEKSVKETIETLCRLLRCHGYHKISPEIFRLAKFNKEEAVADLYLLACEILRIPKQLSKEKQYKEFTKQVNLLNYPSANDLIATHITDLSSQQLLLFVGFLLAKRDLMAQLLQTYEKNLLWLISQPLNVSHSSKLFADEYTFDDVIILNKKIDYEMRRIRSSYRAMEKVMKRFSSEELRLLSHAFNKEKCLDISLLDILVVMNPDLQKSVLTLLTEYITTMTLHLKWLNSEALFWKWMCSILPQSCNVFQTVPSHTRCARLYDFNVENCLLSLLDTNVYALRNSAENIIFHKTDNMARNQSENLKTLNSFLGCNFSHVVHLSEPKR